MRSGTGCATTSDSSRRLRCATSKPRSSRNATSSRGSGKARHAGSVTTRPDPRRTVPAESTPLVGRERDLELAARLFESARILTLFGPGGVGKTRLAYRLATTVAADFQDGIRLVELAPLRDQGAVPAAVADALDVQQRQNRSLPDSIVEMLASQHVLLVLDNCEHVLDTTSELVELILRWCPNVRVLATSRNHSASRPRSCGPFRRSRSRPIAPTRSPRWPRSPRCSSSSNGPVPRVTTSSSTTRTAAQSPRSASGSTACRSRSSSRRHGCAR